MSSRQPGLVIAGVVLLIMAGNGAVAPVLPLYARVLGADLAGIGLLVSAFFVARAVSDLAGAAFSDRVGSVRTTLIGCLLVVLFSIGAALATDYRTLLAFRLGQGLGMSAALLGAMGSMFRGSSSLSADVARFQAAQLLGLLAGPLLGGFVAERSGLATPFWVNAGLGLLAVATLSSAREPVSSSPPARKSDTPRMGVVMGLLSTPLFVAALAVEGILFILRIGIQLTALPLYAVDVAALSEGQVGQLLSLHSAVHLLVIHGAGRVVERFDRRMVGVVGLLGSAVIVALHGYAASFATLALLSAGLGVVGSLAYIVPPVMVGATVKAGSEGLAVGLYRTAGSLGSVIGPLLIGWIVGSAGFRAAFWVMAALMVIVAVLLGGLGRVRR